MRFLLVEDNHQLAQAVCDRLTLDGHVVDRAEDLATADDFIATTEYDLILLDIMLPDGDGRDFLQKHRAARHPTPVIVLTARSEVSDRVGVLDLGADDYIVKPFDFSELEARCRAVLRRQSGGASNVQIFGDVSFDALACTLTVADQQIRLRNRELRLFEIFIGAPDQVFSKSKLVDRLFSYDADVTENAIEVYVGRLRRHLRGARAQIVTVRGLGYRLSLT
ncbi:response regulator transcription factor [Pseudoprimorskyibacter insulae]|uniref:Transcriptional regulatory protein tctD n=1 Tax=Pseudoprimorskyibacter insulae TaxID=1695997 RepID=A0A2R8AYK9_9RHOB|nr:response regulator transcription factor [Pseudoprimorskyibacter insulae]SPF81125.1 Transcriptional regulatory protein tctD [Pseudoprimorskyibacter insulae]